MRYDNALKRGLALAMDPLRVFIVQLSTSSKIVQSTWVINVATAFPCPLDSEHTGDPENPGVEKYSRT